MHTAIPEEAHSQLHLALHFHRQGNLPGAKILYLEVLKKIPFETTALANLAVIESASGNTEAAIGHYQKLVQCKPDDADAHNNLAYMQAMAGRHQDALDNYQKATTLAPNDSQIIVNYGLLLKRLGRLEDALTMFSHSVPVEADNLDILCNRGNIFLEMGKLDEALASYDRALKIDPRNLVVLCNRITLLCDLSRFSEALEAGDLAVKTHPLQAATWAERGTALKNLDRNEDAISSYREALKLNPAHLAAQINLAGLYVSEPDATQESFRESSKSLSLVLASQFGSSAPGSVRISNFRLKHDLQQAQFLHERGYKVEGLERFIDVSQDIFSVHEGDKATVFDVPRQQHEQLRPFLASHLVHQMPTGIDACLNPDNDWTAIEQAYLAGTPEILYIDNFLSPAALLAFQQFCLVSRVWLKEYTGCYLGAFSNQGFISPLHLQLAKELKKAMPRVFRDYFLGQLWAFKYDSFLGKGINVHADFAKVNLNFWLTSDDSNLDKAAGGLKVYTAPAPADWTFHDYNRDTRLIYEHLATNGSECVTVPYKCNRAVLFNSALFHETDTIAFREGYENRRINMTYLFGRQLV
ncbi:MAG: tetratricopeptide repeat protein [Polaromonas sp.]